MNGSTGTAVLNYIINYKEEKKRRREEKGSSLTQSERGR
jgi:hypothetical protein